MKFLRAHYHNEFVLIDFVEASSIDFLKVQLRSIFLQLTEFQLVDFAGRTITISDEVVDILVKEDNERFIAELWIIEGSENIVNIICSSVVFCNEEIVQPQYRFEICLCYF